MSGNVPATLASVAAAVEAVCADLDPSNSFRSFGDDRWVRDVEFASDDHIQRVVFLLDGGDLLLAVYVVLELAEVNSHRLNALAEAITRANYGLLPGCFEIDFESSETRYRSVMYPISPRRAAQIDPTEVAKLLSDALAMAKTYAPAFQKVAHSDADPAEAIDEIEQ